MDTVQDWGDAVMVSATEAMQNLLGFLPALIGAILILIIGWIIAGILAGLIEKGLKTIGFERAAQSTGIAGFIENAGSDYSLVHILPNTDDLEKLKPSQAPERLRGNVIAPPYVYERRVLVATDLGGVSSRFTTILSCSSSTCRS